MAFSAAALVFVGGGVGAVARYGLVRLGEGALGTGLPYGVFVANVAGSFAMGVLVGWLATRVGGLGMLLGMEGHEATKLALATGLLGGFTTFSAFSLDAVRLWEQGSHGLALGYVIGSVVLAIGALILGLALSRGMFA